jgi:hypothetical protein
MVEVIKMRQVCGLLAAIALLLVQTYSALADEVVMKPGVPVTLQTPYWQQNCRSILKSVTNVEATEGKEYVDLQVVNGKMVQPYQCPNTTLPGAWIVGTAKKVTKETTVTLKYTITYDTDYGTKFSTGEKQIRILP